MNYLVLLDGPSTAIVLGGTLIGTVMRSGLARSAVAMRGLFGAFGRPFNAERTRAKLAVQIQDIHREGLLRAKPRRFGDAEFDEMAEALIGRRSVGALLEMQKRHSEARLRRSQIAAETFNLAADLAPVFGLAGTLVALSQMPTQTAPGTMLSSSIPMAVVTTFLGVIAANLLFAPLARLIERRAEKEEMERQKLLAWLGDQVEPAAVRRPLPRERLAA